MKLIYRELYHQFPTLVPDPYFESDSASITKNLGSVGIKKFG